MGKYDQMEDKKILFFEASNADLKIFEPWHKFAEQDVVSRKPRHKFDNVYTFLYKFYICISFHVSLSILIKSSLF